MTFLYRFWFIYSTVNKVQDRKYRMTGQHTRTGVAHYAPHLITHFGLITMYQAIHTGWLRIAKWTFIGSLLRIFIQLCAFGAEYVFATVIVSAIDHYHRPDRCFFTLDSVEQYAFHFGYPQPQF
jgi:hypothetical protein